MAFKRILDKLQRNFPLEEARYLFTSLSACNHHLQSNCSIFSIINTCYLPKKKGRMIWWKQEPTNGGDNKRNFFQALKSNQ